jgi:stress response protein SCP2
MAGGADEVTIYVGQGGEKYSDAADWHDLIVDRRLSRDTWVPVRRGGALQHLRAYDVPELRPLFDALAPPSPEPKTSEPARAPDPPAPSPEPRSGSKPVKAPPVLVPQPAQELPKGANAVVDGDVVLVHLSWLPPPARVEIDGCAYLLAAAGRVRSDADMVFYNQPEAERDAVRLLTGGPTGAAFRVELSRLPSEVARVVFCAAATSAGSKSFDVRTLQPAVEVGAADDQPSIRHRLDLEDGREAGVIFGELYRRAEAWRFRAISQGFHGGLGPLARSYGVVVQD